MTTVTVDKWQDRYEVWAREGDTYRLIATTGDSHEASTYANHCYDDGEFEEVVVIAHRKVHQVGIGVER